jgi:hypothetical protein
MPITVGGIKTAMRTAENTLRDAQTTSVKSLCETIMFAFMQPNTRGVSKSCIRPY